MAHKRMFSKDITESDAFLDMPATTQLLYFHLGMKADDDGFLGNPKSVQKTLSCSDDDMRLLLAKRFLLTFSSGVVVVKHWLINNTVRSDRYNETKYLEEKNSLFIKENKAYSDSGDSGIPLGNQVATQKRIEEDRRVRDFPKKENPTDLLKRVVDIDVDGNPILEPKIKVPKVTKKDFRPFVDEVIALWNKAPNSLAVGVSKPLNPSSVNRLLPSADYNTDIHKLIGVRANQYGGIEKFKLAFKNYATEIINRIPNDKNDYHLNRMSLYDFLYQKNGFVKFINK